MKKKLVINKDGTVDGNKSLTSRQLATAILSDEVDLTEKGVNKDLTKIMEIANKEGPIVIRFREH
ncbi:MAG: hypothetical protein NTZ07_03050 [Candidatus Woesebacteria bacterium]|nr:hypothetical protein [Candidatus Woesebacteria bacterium]